MAGYDPPAMSPLQRRAALVLLLLTWVLCFGQGLVKGVTPKSDGQLYCRIAENLRLDGRYRLVREGPRAELPYAGYEPLHPLFIAVADGLGGKWGYLAAASALVALGMGAWFMAFREWLGPASRLPYLIWALLLWPTPMYLHARWYRREPLVCLLTALTALLLTRVWRSNRRRDAVAASLCWGLAILAKSVWLVFLPLLPLIWWRGGKPMSRCLLALAACAAAVAPWAVRNRLVMPSPVLVSSLGSLSFLNNNVHGLDPWLTTHPEVYPKDMLTYCQDEGASDRECYRRKLAVVAKEPMLALRICAVNLLEFIYPLMGPHFPRDPDEPVHFHPTLIFAYAGMLMALLAGGFRLPRADSALWIPAGMVAAYLAVCMLWIGMALYRAPVEPLILGMGIWGWARWSGGRAGRVRITALAYALAWGASFALTTELRRPVIGWLCTLIGRIA